MAMKKRLLMMALAAFFGLPGVTFADSMYCGNRLISDGDTKPIVLLRCGEPFYKETVSYLTFESRLKRFVHRKKDELKENEFSAQSTIPVEKWYYNFGSNQFIRAVTFEGDTVVKIEELDWPE
jgi:uncharacterized protein DUF2845